MAIKSKTRKSSGTRSRPVARAPRANVVRRKRRRVKLDAFTVLASLFVLALAVFGVWAALRSSQSEKVPGLNGYDKEAVAPIASLGDARKGLDALRTTPLAAGETGRNAAAKAGALAPQIQDVVNAVEGADAPGKLVLPQALQSAGVLSLHESAMIYQLGSQPSVSDALRAQLGRKAGRLSQIADGLLDAGSRALKDVTNGDDFASVGADVPDLSSAVNAEGAPLDGVGALSVHLVAENAASQSASGYAQVVKSGLTAYDAAITQQGTVVSSSLGSSNGSLLTAPAKAWTKAAVTLAASLSGAKRPDKAQGGDVELRDAALLSIEAARSFASASAVPSMLSDLITSGKRLRLIADRLRTAGVGELHRVTSVVIAAPPQSGFDQSLIIPASAGSTSTTLGNIKVSGGGQVVDQNGSPYPVSSNGTVVQPGASPSG